MNLDLEKQRLPEIYIRGGKECYLDPIRKKLIYITPEETVRQRVISYLIDECGVPMELIYVEELLSKYGIDSNRRADIVVNYIDSTGDIKPLAIIECKAPDVPLGEKEQDQVLDYCDLVNCDYAMLTNGYVCSCIKYDEEKNSYFYIENLPKYKNMIDGEYKEWTPGKYPERIAFENLREEVEEEFRDRENIEEATYISPMTDMSIAVPAFNLLECLLDYRVKMPEGNYGKFKLISDYGVRMLTYGNASGGQFFGPYRSFLIETNGSTEFVSMSIETYFKSSGLDNVKTCLSVAIDNEKETHHSLQLGLDDNLEVKGDICDFYHSGRIAVGHMGSGKISELRELVKKECPSLVCGKRFFLGSLVHNRLWRLDDPEVIHLISNLITYALIRDEYRIEVKKKRK